HSSCIQDSDTADHRGPYPVYSSPFLFASGQIREYHFFIEAIDHAGTSWISSMHPLEIQGTDRLSISLERPCVGAPPVCRSAANQPPMAVAQINAVAECEDH